MTDKYVLTKKGNISSPAIYSRGFDFKSELDYAYSFECLCSDNVNTVNIHVFNTPDIPRGFEKHVQAVPLSLFMQNTQTERGLLLLEQSPGVSSNTI